MINIQLWILAGAATIWAVLKLKSEFEYWIDGRSEKNQDYLYRRMDKLEDRMDKK